MKYPKTAPVKVIIIGAGGTGGYVIPHLYRIGFATERSMRILVCDGDVVEEKNLIRQNFVEQDVGRNKAQVWRNGIPPLSASSANISHALWKTMTSCSSLLSRIFPRTDGEVFRKRRG